jgi:putative nucleotidyltransferase with HDIG domain
LRTLRLETLRSKVARRILSLFVVSAIVPVAVLSVTSFFAVTGQLRKQSEERLDRLTDLATQSILGRLFNMHVLLDISASAAAGETGTLSLPPGLEGVLVLDANGEVRARAGQMSLPDEISQAERAHLDGNEALLRTVPGAGLAPPEVLMAVATPAPDDGGVLWAKILADSIWSAAQTQVIDGDVDEMCVLDSSGVPHHCYAEDRSSTLAPHIPIFEAGGPVSDFVEIPLGDGRLAAWRGAMLGSSYRSPPWTVAISQSLESVHSPARAFAYYTVIAVLAGLVATVTLTHVVVRRTMEPLEQLIDGTERIANHDLTTRVEVLSDDEFGDLAISFNMMAQRLGFQFSQLEAGRAIDQAVLSASDKREAVQALLVGIAKVVPTGERGVFLLEAGSDDAASFYAMEAGGDTVTLDAFSVPHTTTALYDVPREPFLAETAAAVPWALQSRTEEEWTLPVLVLPLIAQGEPFGCVGLASLPGEGFDEEDTVNARGLVDQAAVGLNELRLRVELAETSWEALRALANAIDAKSQWTAGHSQRVTDLAMLIGREVGLNERETDILHRGGLLHDIGKIGVDATILDFPGPLDAEQREAIQQHPQIGADILAPLRVFQPMMPIVLHHHERWDGKGYPDGLSGEAIPHLARLLAVADVYDAMVSARPYRDAMDPNKVRDIIIGDSGTAFDPDMVVAFQAVIASGWTPTQTEHDTFHV